jgi:hypothetical protein
MYLRRLLVLAFGKDSDGLGLERLFFALHPEKDVPMNV